MIIKSRYPELDVPIRNILSFIFDEWKFSWDKPVYIDSEDPTQVITVSQLRNLTRRIGCGLQKFADVHPGDVVMLCTPNSLLVPPVMLGIVCAGAALSGSNPKSTESELKYQINDTGTKVFFVGRETVDIITHCLKLLGMSTDKVFLLTTEKSKRTDGVKTVGDLLEYGEIDWERPRNYDEMHERIAALNYSSGTTGPPKGCKITMYNIVAHCVQSQMLRDLGREDARKRGCPLPDTERVLVFVPFYHAMGQQHYVFNALKFGDTTYVMNAYSFPKLLTCISSCKITTFAVVPPIVVSLAKHPLVQETDLSSLRSLLCGAAPLGAETQIQAEEAMARKGTKVIIQQAWGMSEVTLAATSFFPLERDPDVTGVGYINPGMEARIVDDNGKDVNPGEEGEILLKGPNVFEGYWRKEKETKEAFVDGCWYKTGDIAVVKRDGIIHIVDRKKELIKVKGLQVAPAELEDLLLKNPDVEDAAVIGIQGEGTEYPRAYIVPSRSGISSKSIQNYVAKHVARHKHLTGGVVFVDVIPKNGSGKILRRQLRERAKKETASVAYKAKM